MNTLTSRETELLALLRDARRELIFANLTDDGGQRKNTPAARVISMITAAVYKFTGAHW